MQRNKLRFSYVVSFVYKVSKMCIALVFLYVFARRIRVAVKSKRLILNMSKIVYWFNTAQPVSLLGAYSLLIS
jgi:hypothetical protein